jgi:hypothetical protein
VKRSFNSVERRKNLNGWTSTVRCKSLERELEHKRQDGDANRVGHDLAGITLFPTAPTS